MEDNSIKIGVEQLMSGLDSMVKGLEKTVTESYSKMSGEQAVQFAKEMEKANVSTHVEELKKGIVELKTNLNV